MTATPEQPKRVVLRYEDDWDELRAQLQSDRAIGLTRSSVRDHLTGWLDQGSFVELGSLVRRDTSSYRGGESIGEEQNTTVPADGLIAGWGSLGGQLVFITADDTALGSSVWGGAAAAKATRVRHHALEQSAPLIQVLAASRTDDETFIGAEFVRFGYGVDLDFEHQSTERILKIAIVTGSLHDQAALEAGWSHIVILAGPDAAMYGHRADAALRRGFADLVAADLPNALRVATGLLHHLPPNRFSDPPAPAAASTSQPEHVDQLLDDGWAVELGPEWCPASRTWLGRIGGRTAGLVRCADGLSLDGATVRKLLRIAGFCRAFSLPLVLTHAGIDRATSMSLADLNDLAQLRAELASSQATVLELARTARSIRTDLGVTPIWSVGPTSDQAHDEVAALSEHRAALREVIVTLERSRPRPDQDERVKRRRPRGLQAG